MKHILYSLGLSLILTLPASAACFADYKAKHVNGTLSLHYGVIEVPDGACANPSAHIAKRLNAQGWELLRVLSTFDEGGLASRRQNAGAYYLAF